MSRLTGWLYSLRSLARRNAADRDMADEIEFHIERQTRKHESQGLTRAEARRRALLEFGGTSRWREEARHARGSAVIDAIEQDLRHTFRGLRRDPLFATMAITTLALAIGANAAMFGILDRLLLRGPEHVAEPDQLARVYVTRALPDGNRITSGWQPYVFYASAREQAPALAAVATYAAGQLRVGMGTASRLVSVTYATPDLFPLTGAHPALGRFFSDDDDRPPAGERVVVLGYRYWQNELAGDSAVIGRLIPLGDDEFRVVGVAPRGFTGVELTPVDAWLPMRTRALTGEQGPPDWTTNWQFSIGSVVARVRGPKGAAESQLTAILRRAYVGNAPGMRTATARLLPISYGSEGTEPKEVGVARLLAGVALVMLLVATANAANLTLARAVRRRRELSVRAALGAGRWRTVRLMLVETVTIALLAALVGLVFAHWGGAIIRQALLPDVAWGEMPVDGRVLLWTMVASVVAGVAVGLVPAVRVTGGDVAAALRAGRTGGGSTSDSHGTARAALQIVQLALSVVLLFAAGLFVRSLRDIRRLDLGYDRDQVLAVDVSFPPPSPATGDSASRSAIAARARYQDLRARFERLPNVAGASIAFGSPLSSVNIVRVRVPGRDSLPPSKGGRALVTNAAPGYFETVGTRILRGRSFVANEGAGTEPVVIVNETMAKAIWPGGDAVGHCVELGRLNGGACARVVGVAQDVHIMNLKEPALSQFYIPWGQDPRAVDGSRLLVRARGDAAKLVAALNGALRDVPGVQFVEIETFEEALDPQVRPWRVGATLFGLFGAIVVAVAAIGLFSVVSYLVTQRTHELGVRIALGARNAQVLRLILGSGLRTAAVGALAGSVASIAVAPVLEPLLFDNRAQDPGMLAGVAAVLMTVAGVASVWPSWRATRIDPVLAIRAD
jgi:predicted permease